MIKKYIELYKFLEVLDGKDVRYLKKKLGHIKYADFINDFHLGQIMIVLNNQDGEKNESCYSDHVSTLIRAKLIEVVDNE